MKSCREWRGLGQGMGGRTLLIGAFLAGEELGGLGNREGPCEPTDIASNLPLGVLGSLLDQDRMGRVFIKATWWEMAPDGGRWRVSRHTLAPPRKGGWSFLSKLQPPVY